MHTCDLCGQTFTPTAPNPGTTYVSDFADNPSKVLILYICDTDVPVFYTMTAEEQQAKAEAVNRAA